VIGPCLRGITWNHSRAFPPLAAAAQRFEELHPQISIVWDKRSLDEFGHASLDEFGHASLAEFTRAYDLLIVDHLYLARCTVTALLSTCSHCCCRRSSPKPKLTRSARALKAIATKAASTRSL
jgi:hypothetical protein